MKKLNFCQCENKGADQPCSNCMADLRLCFRFMHGRVCCLLNSEIGGFLSSFFCDCTDWLVSNQVGTPKDLFSRVVAFIACG